MQSIDHISEKLEVSPTLDPFLGMCRIMRANLRTDLTLNNNIILYLLWHNGLQCPSF